MAPLTAVLALALALGCASSSVTPGRRLVGDEPLPRPGVVLIYDFAVDPADVVVDTLGPEFATGPGERGERAEFGRAVARSLSEQLVAKLRERGIRAERAFHPRVPPVNALLLKGQFLSVDEGDRAKRMVIGFGAGSSELLARVQVYQATQTGLRRIAEAEAEASSAKTPGMAQSVGAGAAAGTAATSAVISGGMKVTTELRGTLEADAGRLAEEIAERAEAFYKRQGWL
jgi:hypothetical protein